MLQRSDYTILDHLTEICEVVDFDLCYSYVNEAAAERENIPREELIGNTMLELHPGIESTRFFLHLRKCLEERKPAEFEDNLSYPNCPVIRWKVRIDPIAEGALIHSMGVTTNRTNVKLRRNRLPSAIAGGNPWRAAGGLSRDPSRDMQIEGWLDSLDVRTRETTDHIFHVTDGTVALARMAGLPESEIVQIRYGALLHDIGKIGIPDAILLKADRLTAEELGIVHRHPTYARDLLYPVEYLRDCLSIPYSHHEKWDGTGYPQGLKGEQIPLPARLFAIVEVWDVLSCDRSYAKAWPQEKIAQYIHGQSGTHFDPQVVDLFFQYHKKLASMGSR